MIMAYEENRETSPRRKNRRGGRGPEEGKGNEGEKPIKATHEPCRDPKKTSFGRRVQEDQQQIHNSDKLNKAE